MSFFRIMYLTFNDPYASPGVHKKEQEFCSHMERNCLQRDVNFRGVNLFTSEYAHLGRINGQGPLAMREVISRLHDRLRDVRFLRAFSRLYLLLQGAYEEIRRFDPNLVYWRYDIINVPGFFTPKKVSSDIIFVTEHQTKEIEELILTFTGKIKMPLVWSYEKSNFQKVDALVGVTTEIADYKQATLKRKVPVFVHSNGIDVPSCPRSPYVAFKNENLRMVYLGASTPNWQGLDRLIEGITAYRGSVIPELHIVGHVTPELERLISNNGLTEAVHIHGMLHGTALDQVLSKMHVAVGTLGIHRKGLKYGCTLKVREYMARGIPFFFSYIDEDIKDDFPLCLRIPSDESPVDIHDIVNFMENIHNKYGDRIPDLMRSYALEYMDYDEKVVRLLDFLLSLASIERGGAVL